MEKTNNMSVAAYESPTAQIVGLSQKCPLCESGSKSGSGLGTLDGEEW